MRSRSTCRPTSTSAMLAAAPPAAASAPEMASHSACHAPAARSCSWARLAGEQRGSPGHGARRRARGSTRPGSACAASSRSRRALARRLGDLADLRLGHQHDVERDLAERAGERRERRAERGDAHARGVPRQRGLGQAEVARDGGDDGGAVLAERGERARRTAQLDGQPVARGEHELLRLEHAREPRRRLSPNVVGNACWSSVRATIGVARWVSASSAQVAVTARRPRGSARGRAGDEHRGGVDDVLARRAVVDVPAASPPTAARSARTSGSAGLPDPRPSAAMAPGSNSSARHAAAMASAAAAGISAELGLGGRERALDVEHRLQPGAVGSSSSSGCGVKIASNIPDVLHALEADVVLGQHRRGRAARTRRCAIARAAAAARTDRRRGEAVQHRGHPPREVLGAPDAAQAGLGVGVEQRGAAAAVPARERLGEDRTSAIARLRPLAPVGGTMCAASPAR